jgi:hypothetical protein
MAVRHTGQAKISYHVNQRKEDHGDESTQTAGPEAKEIGHSLAA